MKPLECQESIRIVLDELPPKSRNQSTSRKPSSATCGTVLRTDRIKCCNRWLSSRVYWIFALRILKCPFVCALHLRFSSGLFIRPFGLVALVWGRSWPCHLSDTTVCPKVEAHESLSYLSGIYYRCEMRVNPRPPFGIRTTPIPSLRPEPSGPISSSTLYRCLRSVHRRCTSICGRSGRGRIS